MIKSDKGTVGLRGVDPDSLVESIPTTDTFHHLCHHGMVFLHSSKHEGLANGADHDTLIKVPASPSGRQIHLRFLYTVTEVDCDVCLYRDVTVSADGTPENIESINDAVVKITGVTIFEGPTITDLGNMWTCSLITGSKKAAGTQDQLVPEWVLTAGVNYLIRLTNNTGGAIDLVNAVFFFDSEAA